MTQTELNGRGILLLGCGKMGSALLKGWISSGLAPESIFVLEPNPSPWVLSQDVVLNGGLPAAPPAVCVIAVKPQILPDAVKSVAPLGGGRTLILSIAAGIRIEFLDRAFGAGTPVIRAMPNTPAAIGHGISALIGNELADPGQLDLAEQLLSAVGETVRLERESQMDAVTALSGSGPAYVFHMIEAMAQAGSEQGLPPDLALRLAKSTVAGAGKLAVETGSSPSQLRIDVTSPAGTTEAALKFLMDENTGLAALMSRSVRAAAERSRELGESDD